MKNRGSTLIQLLVISSIMSGAILGIAKIIGLNQKLVKNTSIYSNLKSQTRFLTNILLDSESCISNFSKNKKIELVNDKILYKVVGYDENRDVIEYINSTSNSSNSPLEIDKFEIRISKQDANQYGISNLKYTKDNSANHAEFVIHMISKASKKFSFSQKNKQIRIALQVNYSPQGHLLGCYAKPDNYERYKEAMAKTIKGVCGAGLIFNNNLENPQCIPTIEKGGVETLANCKNGNFVNSIFWKNNSGKLVMSATCTDVKHCKNGEIGIWKGENLICKKCNDDEFTLFSQDAVMCSSLDCTKGSDIKYMSGVKADGSPICRSLVDASNPVCGENGFQIIKTSTDDGVKVSCCDSCPDTSNICEGTYVKTTSDCKIRCEGTMKRKPMNYGEWGECETVSFDTRIINVIFFHHIYYYNTVCEEERELSCKNIDVNGIRCCDSGASVKQTRRSCYNGTWMAPASTCLHSGDETYRRASCNKIARPGSEYKPKCCDPKLRPRDIYCPGKLSQSNISYKECLDDGGVLQVYENNTYCYFRGECPDKYSKARYQIDVNSVHEGEGDSKCSPSRCIFNEEGKEEHKDTWFYYGSQWSCKDFCMKRKWNSSKRKCECKKREEFFHDPVVERSLCR